MIYCGMFLIGRLMYSGHYIVVPRHKFDTSSVNNLDPGVDSTEFHTILIVGKFNIGVIISYKHTVMSPPKASLDLLGYALCGLYETTIIP